MNANVSFLVVTGATFVMAVAILIAVPRFNRWQKKREQRKN